MLLPISLAHKPRRTSLCQMHSHALRYQNWLKPFGLISYWWSLCTNTCLGHPGTGVWKCWGVWCAGGSWEEDAPHAPSPAQGSSTPLPEPHGRASLPCSRKGLRDLSKLFFFHSYISPVCREFCGFSVFCFFFFFSTLKWFLNFHPAHWSIIIIILFILCYFLVLVLIEREPVHKLFIFLNGSSLGVFAMRCCVFTEQTVL